MNKVVYTATADDSVETSTPITFSLGGADASTFTINTATSAVTLTANPVYDTKSSYSFYSGKPPDNAEALGTGVTLTVLEDEDGDGIHDQTDTCLIDGCTVQQLTDAYARAASVKCVLGSRRTHAHRQIWCVYGQRNSALHQHRFRQSRMLSRRNALSAPHKLRSSVK